MFTGRFDIFLSHYFNRLMRMKPMSFHSGRSDTEAIQRLSLVTIDLLSVMEGFINGTEDAILRSQLVAARTEVQRLRQAAYATAEKHRAMESAEHQRKAHEG